MRTTYHQHNHQQINQASNQPTNKNNNKTLMNHQSPNRVDSYNPYSLPQSSNYGYDEDNRKLPAAPEAVNPATAASYFQSSVIKQQHCHDGSSYIDNDGDDCKMASKKLINLPDRPSDRNDTLTFFQSSPLVYKEDDDDDKYGYDYDDDDEHDSNYSEENDNFEANRPQHEKQPQVHPIIGAAELNANNDFNYEYNVIEDALLEGANKINGIIKTQRSVATINKFSSFLSKSSSTSSSSGTSSSSPVMHLSTHSEDEIFLTIEDNYGCRRIVKDKELRSFISPQGEHRINKNNDHGNIVSSSLQLVVVSSNQPYGIANSFIGAGIKHVVCCQRCSTGCADNDIENGSGGTARRDGNNKNDTDQVTIAFLRHFYRTLASGDVTLQVAFDRAFEQVKEEHPATMMMIDPATNTDNRPKMKFSLLPHNGNHHVQIFFKKPNHFSSNNHNDTMSQQQQQALSRLLPNPPKYFIGRELDMHRIIKALTQQKQSKQKRRHNPSPKRLIRIIGPDGIGKMSLVNGVLKHMNDRSMLSDTNTTNDGSGGVIWLPPINEEAVSDDLILIMFILAELYESICKNNTSSRSANDNFRQNDTYMSFLQLLDNDLRQRKLLIVVDARKISGHDSVGKLSMFLNDLCSRTNNVQVITVLNPTGYDIMISCRSSTCSSHDVTEDIELYPLDGEASVKLFGSLCYHKSPSTSSSSNSFSSSFPKELENLYINSKVASETIIPYTSILRYSHVYRLLGCGNPKEIYANAKHMTQDGYDRLVLLGQFNTRYDLEQQIMKLKVVYNEKVEEEQSSFNSANEIKENINELEFLRDCHPDIDTLQKKAVDVSSDMYHAKMVHEVDAVTNLQNQLQSINLQIDLERKHILHPPKQQQQQQGISNNQQQQEDSCGSSSGGDRSHTGSNHSSSLDRRRDNDSNTRDQQSKRSSCSGSIKAQPPPANGVSSLDQSSCSRSQNSYSKTSPPPPSPRPGPPPLARYGEGCNKMRSIEHANSLSSHSRRRDCNLSMTSDQYCHPQSSMSSTSSSKQHNHEISAPIKSKMQGRAFGREDEANVPNKAQHRNQYSTVDQNGHHDQFSCAHSQTSSHHSRLSLYSKGTAKTEPSASYSSAINETRVYIETELERLQLGHDTAIRTNDTKAVEIIDNKIRALNDQKANLPTIEELEHEIRETTVDMEAAKYGLRYDECDELLSKIKELQSKYELEREAEAVLRPNLHRTEFYGGFVSEGFAMGDAITEEEPSDISDDDEPDPWEVAGMPRVDPSEIVHPPKKGFKMNLYVPNKGNTKVATTPQARSMWEESPAKNNRTEQTNSADKRAVTPRSANVQTTVSSREAGQETYKRGIPID